MRSDLEQHGFAWLRGGLDAATLADTRTQLHAMLVRAAADPAVLSSGDGPAYGARNLLRLWPEAATLIRGEFAQVVREILGPKACVVRGLYFDKPPGQSWALPWHRDYTIAVQQHHASTRFQRPTIKAGVPHVEAPRELLMTMLTLRLHLDAMTDDNGPLRVVPGSHATESNDAAAALTLHCAAGDVLLMRPLLLHASGHSTPDTPQHRRIVHLECAMSSELPDGYTYDQCMPIHC